MHVRAAVVIFSALAGCGPEPPAAAAPRPAVRGPRASRLHQRAARTTARAAETVPEAQGPQTTSRRLYDLFASHPGDEQTLIDAFERLAHETDLAEIQESYAGISEAAAHGFVHESAQARALEHLRGLRGALPAVAFVRWSPSGEPDFRKAVAPDAAKQQAWTQALVETVDATTQDAVLEAVAIDITPATRGGRVILEALVKRAATMPSGEPRRVVFESEFVFAVNDDERWEHMRAVWDAQGSDERRNDVAAAAVVVLAENSRREPSAEEAAALKPSMLHVFAASRDQDIQQTFARAAARELGQHMDAKFLRALADAAVNDGVRKAYLDLARSVELSGEPDLDAFDDTITPGWRDPPGEETK